MFPTTESQHEKLREPNRGESQYIYTFLRRQVYMARGCGVIWHVGRVKVQNKKYLKGKDDENWANVVNNVILTGWIRMKRRTSWRR